MTSNANRFLKGEIPDAFIDIKGKILSCIDSEKYYSELLIDFEYDKNRLCPFPDHADTDPSFRVNSDNTYKCFGCDKRGTNIIQFWMDVNKKKDYKAAAAEFYKAHVAKEIPNNKITLLRKNLHANNDTLRFLQETRGWSRHCIDYFRLGLYRNEKGAWITIPVIDEYGFTTQLKLYNYGHIEGPKFFFDKEGITTPYIFPIEVLASTKTVYIFEGEPDCLLALSLGYPAITFGAANNWKDTWTQYFSGFDVIVCYDNDEAGNKGALALEGKLEPICKSLKVVEFPKGQDFTDFFTTSGNTKDAFDTLIAETSYKKITTEPTTNRKEEFDFFTEGKKVTFNEATYAENYNKQLLVSLLALGKEPAPLMIPKKVQAQCRDNQTIKKCANCDLGDEPAWSKMYHIDPFHKKFSDLIVPTKKEVTRHLRELFNINLRCKVDIDIREVLNVEKSIVGAPIQHGRLNPKPDRRLAYFIGSDLTINRHYSTSLFTIPHPHDKYSIHIVTGREVLDTELETFKHGKDSDQLLQIFQIDDKDETTIHRHLTKMYNTFAYNITRIWNRFDLHLGIDLLYFAPNSFVFDKEYIPRTGLDVLIFGDQRCGKGKIAEGLSNYYRFGEVLSGENLSFMNLIGGIESSDNYRGLRWGRLVANNRGVVVIDEVSSLPTEIIGKLSRIRSEGIAELDKYGIHSKAEAKCSTLWISNPRTRSLGTFNFGVEAIPELVGQPEDVARFDYVVCVRADEVDPTVINKSHVTTEDPLDYSMHRQLILWCKTRQPEQVEFTPDAMDTIYKEALKLGKYYTSNIPLIQAENVRIKLAKISAAIAGRLYSTDGHGQKLIIKPGHVKYAVKYLNKLYDHSALGYGDYSKIVIAAEKINYDMLKTVKEKLTEDEVWDTFVSELLNRNYLTSTDISDITGLYTYDTKSIISMLVRSNVLIKKNRGYVKTQAFIQFLKTEHGAVHAKIRAEIGHRSI
jgi:hypothetical protein